MTNIEFFDLFAQNAGYYIEHNNENLDFSKILKADNSSDTQIKMIHYTSKHSTFRLHVQITTQK